MKAPDSILIEVNYRCYLECKMCSKHQWVRDGAPERDILSTGELVYLFRNLSDLGVKTIMLTGTEPVIRHDICELLHEIRRLGMKPELYSSGIKMDENIASEIITSRVDVAFSLDGFFASSHNKIRMDGHNYNAFEKTLSSINLLKNKRAEKGLGRIDIEIMSNFVVQNGNIHNLDRVSHEDIKEIGVDRIRMSIAHGSPSLFDFENVAILKKFSQNLSSLCVNTEIDLAADIAYLVSDRISKEDFVKGARIASDILNGSKRVRCQRGFQSSMIDPIGNVRGCQYLYDDNGAFGKGNRDSYILGNIRNMPFSEIWNGNSYDAYRNGGFPDLSIGSRCLNCEYMNTFEI